MSYLIGLLAFIFILGTAVVIHEFGHFIVAKLLRIRVEIYSVGFGPRLFGWRFGTTDYRLSAIPLGGYVKLGGDESNASIEGESALDIPDRERFDLRPRRHKFLVIVAGPVMNILLALAIPFGVAMWYGVPVPPPPVIASVDQAGAADKAGIKPGDRLVTFNGKENPTSENIRMETYLMPDQTIPVTVERGNERLNLSVTPSKRVENDETGGYLDANFYGVTISLVDHGGPAEEAGLQPGDHLLALNDFNAISSEKTVDYIQQHKGQPITVHFERDGDRRQVILQTRRLSDGREGLGVALTEGVMGRTQATLLDGASFAVAFNYNFIHLTAKAIGQIFNGQRSARDTLAGPIGIARIASTAANESGWSGVFGMLGFLSLNLGLMNLLPIPVLDGGAIFILFVEAILAVIGLKLTLGMRERIQQVGFVVLILLMVFVIANDLIKLVS